MDWFLIGVDVISEDGFFVFFLEGNLVSVGIVGDCDDIACGELKSLMLAIELHLIAVP